MRAITENLLTNFVSWSLAKSLPSHFGYSLHDFHSLGKGFFHGRGSGWLGSYCSSNRQWAAVTTSHTPWLWSCLEKCFTGDCIWSQSPFCSDFLGINICFSDYVMASSVILNSKIHFPHDHSFDLLLLQLGFILCVFCLAVCPCTTCMS